MTDINQSWQRLSLLSVLFFIVKFIRIYWYGFVPILLSDTTFRIDKWLAFVLALILIIAFSFLQYYFFRYHISTDKISIYSGVFIKRMREMNRDRIQNINLEQNMIYRLFSLRQIKFESAGSSKTEFILPAIDQTAYEQIQQFMNETNNTTENETTPLEKPEVSDLVYKLNFRDLIIHGLSSSRIGIVIGGIFTFYDSIKQTLADWFGTFINIESTIENELLINNSTSVIIFYILFFLFLIFFFSILVEFLIYYGFSLRFSNDIFSKTHGLFNKKDEHINAKKVQQLVIKQNPVMMLFKRYNGYFKIADSSENKETKKSFTLISINPHLIKRIKNILFPEWELSEKKQYKVQKQMLFHRFKYFFIYPGILLLFAFFFFDNSFVLLGFILPVILVLQSILIFKTRQITVSNEMIAVKFGRFFKTESQAEFYKFQWVRLKQNRYQRRKKLASLTIGHASGTLTVPYLTLMDATELFDWLLYKIESSQAEWI